MVHLDDSGSSSSKRNRSEHIGVLLAPQNKTYEGEEDDGRENINKLNLQGDPDLSIPE